MAFRTDGTAILATAGPTGAVALWNLDERRVAGVMNDCHGAAVTALHFLKSEPLLVTAGADNALKVWVFDQVRG